MKKQHVITILIGIPCSGKSTWVENNRTNETLISRDNVVMELCDVEDYDYCHKETIRTADLEYNNRLNLAIKNREDIIVDRTNLRKKSRLSILGRIPKSYYVKAVVFEHDLFIVLERNLERKKEINKYIPLNIIEKMIETSQAVELEEGFDEIVTIKA